MPYITKLGWLGKPYEVWVPPVQTPVVQVVIQTPAQPVREKQ